jgi:enoyl-CoA hydratase/3-hydroxyacyl-CoA dehydrogenase
MNLLEVVRTNKTSPQVVLDVIELAKVLNKTPIVVGNCVGFTVNRMFFPYTQAAVFLVERGIDLYRIDKVLENFGMPMGVFKMTDLAGVDVCNYVMNITCNGYKDRVYRTTLLDSLAKEKRFGMYLFPW